MAAGAALSIDVVTCCCSTLVSGSRVRRRSELARVHAKTSRQLSRGACQGGVRRVARLVVRGCASCLVSRLCHCYCACSRRVRYFNPRSPPQAPINNNFSRPAWRYDSTHTQEFTTASCCRQQEAVHPSVTRGETSLVPQWQRSRSIARSGRPCSTRTRLPWLSTTRAWAARAWRT